MKKRMSEEEILKEAEEDSAWVTAHHDELRAKYEGKVFAVKNKKVIGASDRLEKLLAELEKKGEDTAFLLIESVPPKNLSFIL